MVDDRRTPRFRWLIDLLLTVQYCPVSYLHAGYTTYISHQLPHPLKPTPAFFDPPPYSYSTRYGVEYTGSLLSAWALPTPSPFGFSTSLQLNDVAQSSPRYFISFNTANSGEGTRLVSGLPHLADSVAVHCPPQ